MYTSVDTKDTFVLSLTDVYPPETSTGSRTVRPEPVSTVKSFTRARIQVSFSFAAYLYKKKKRVTKFSKIAQSKQQHPQSLKNRRMNSEKYQFHVSAYVVGILIETRKSNEKDLIFAKCVRVLQNKLEGEVLHYCLRKTG